ncbi:MAG: AI-2E family transporter [Acidobacteriota bacterium]
MPLSGGDAALASLSGPSDAPTPAAAEVEPDKTRALIVKLLITLVVLAVAVTLWAAQELFIPIVFALLLSYALDPWQRFLRRRRVPAALAAAIVVLTTLAAIGATGWALRSQADAFIASLPATARQVRQAVQGSSGKPPAAVAQMQEAAKEIQRASAPANTSAAPPGVTRVQVEAQPFSGADLIWKSGGGALLIAGQALAVVVLVFYFLASGDLYKRRLVKIAGRTLTQKRVTVEILDDIERQIARYLAARLAVSTVVTVATTAAFWWLGMPQPGVWGIVAGLLNVIPYVGPAAFTVGASLAAFVHFGTAAHAVLIGAASTAIGTVEGFLITPIIMGRAGGMNGLAVFLSLTLWGFLWGFWGMLLAVPLTMAMKVLAEHLEELNGLGEFLRE